ncbi:MAG: hypothetical protein EA383_06690 [Spirochaetaceae bacterium]|nr:MAG: hypothetical protein EA383_06690 [Spirochaetaceae bacterium]
MAQKRSRFILYSGILILAFLLLDPFNIMPNRGVRRPGIDAERAAAMAQHLETMHRSPEDYLLDALQENQIVFLGTIGRIRQHTEFVAQMVEALPLSGVHTIAVDFLLADDQEIVDGLVSGSTFDRRTAADLLLRRDVLFGFEDYVDVLEAVWDYNRSRPDDSEAIRLIALSQRFNYAAIETREDIQNPERMRAVLPDGPPDTYMANQILDRIVETDRKALVFIRKPHALSGLNLSSVGEQMAELGFEDVRPAGVQVRDAVGDGVVTFLLHGPWPDSGRMQGMNYAADGYIDAVLDRLPDGLQRVGFTLGADPLGSLGIRTTQLGDPENPRAFRDIADGYLVVERSARLAASRVIPDFYTSDNIEYARQNFPGPPDDSMDEQSLQEYLRGIVQAFDRNLREFR